MSGPNHIRLASCSGLEPSYAKQLVFGVDLNGGKTEAQPNCRVLPSLGHSADVRRRIPPRPRQRPDSLKQLNGQSCASKVGASTRLPRNCSIFKQGLYKTSPPSLEANVNGLWVLLKWVRDLSQPNPHDEGSLLTGSLFLIPGPWADLGEANKWDILMYVLKVYNVWGRFY